jgi:hypothetical protein
VHTQSAGEANQVWRPPRLDYPARLTAFWLGTRGTIANAHLGQLNRPVVVAMIAMLAMQALVYEVVDVVTVRYGLVSTVGAMRVV